MPHPTSKASAKPVESEKPGSVEDGPVLLRPLPSHDLGLIDKSDSREKLFGMKMTRSFDVMDET